MAFLFLIAIATWFGAMVFWSFFATPRIFAAYDRQQAGDIVGLVFPNYYLLGTVCGGIALVTGIAGDAVGGFGKVVVLAMLLLNVYAGTLLRVRIEAAKRERRAKDEAGAPDAEAAAKRFGALHAQSMVINLVVMGCGLAVLYLFIRHGGG